MMDYINLALGQWSFFAAALVLFGINESLKKFFPQPEEKKAHAYIWAFLPLWPVLFGGLFGALHGSPLPLQVREFGILAGPLYFSCAGVLAIHLRDIVLTYIKYAHPDLYAKMWSDSTPPSH